MSTLPPVWLTLEPPGTGTNEAETVVAPFIMATLPTGEENLAYGIALLNFPPKSMADLA
jgi:hypothetical protein